MNKLNFIQYYNKYGMELTEDQIFGKYAKKCNQCSRKTLLPYYY